MIYYRGLTIDRKRMIIANGDDVMLFVGRRCPPSPGRFRLLCDLILGSGYTKDELVVRLWADDPDGGPLYAHKIIEVWFCTNAGLFRRLGLRLIRLKQGDSPRGRYHLAPLKAGRRELREG